MSLISLMSKPRHDLAVSCHCSGIKDLLCSSFHVNTYPLAILSHEMCTYIAFSLDVAQNIVAYRIDLIFSD